MKKIISLHLVVFLLFAAFPFCAFAESAPAFSVGTASAKAGETVQVPVCIADNSGIVALKVMISYDADVLTFTGAENGNLFSGGEVMFGNDITANPYNLLWIDPLSTTDYTDNGTFAVLHFTIRADAPAGDTAITIAYESGSTFDADLDEVTFATQNGTVTVLPAEVGGWHFDENTTLRTLHGQNGVDFVVGLDDWDLRVKDYVVTTGGWSAEVILNTEGLESTGAQLVIYDETHTETERYEIVLYGDVNGNGIIESADIALILSALNHSGTLEWEDYWYTDEFAESMAADVNHDGFIGSADIADLLCVLNYEIFLNQCWTEDTDLPYLV